MNWTAIAVIAIAISPTLLLSASVKAQNITAAQDGTGTVILPNGQRFDITGGTHAGANLFHSFQQFGLNQGQIANFLSQPNIQNILGRVVGGDPSVINGLIQLTGGNSNLYIMNPAGIIFGANASLNVPAAFTATTANGIQVGNAWFGMNTSASDLQNLTGTPNAFAFTSPTTSLAQGQTTGVIVNQGNLSVPSGNSISLVGGIVINTGTISTPNGKINIVVVPDGKYVRITPEGSALSLDLPIATQKDIGNAKPMTVVNLPSLLTGTGITAPTQSGTAIVRGNLTALGIDILANRYDTSQASLNAANIQQGWNFVFIDSTIKLYQTLLDGTKGGSSVTLINPDQYGIAQVTKTLASVTGANSLHIVSEGDAGNFWLGKDFVSGENIAKYSNDLQAWKTALSPAANILLYACNLADGVNGIALVQAVKNLTGHDVAASTDLTGSSNLGANWNLEYATGKINAGVVFGSEAQNSFNGRLVTFTVGNINDLGAGSLRQAIIDANALVGADDIRFDTTGVFAAPQIITLTTGELGITQDLSIQGTGASNLTISGNNTSRVFNISGASTTVNIDGLTVANGQVSSEQGAGILVNTGSTLNLTNSVIANNNVITASSDGAGLANNGTATLTNAIVRNNNAADDGGGIRNGGVMTISNSTISNNTAIGTSATSGGGGIINVIGGMLTITNSTVSGNTAPNGGGLRNDGTATINNIIFLNNQATTGTGGAIAATNGVIPLTLSNSTISGNTSAVSGGGIVSNGAVTLTNSTVSGNSTTFGSGGGIVSNGAVTLTNSTVSGNSTTFGSGGGIFSNGAVALTNSTVSGNSANGSGGGIVSNGAVTLTNSTVSGNSAANGNGGGIFGFGAVTLTNSTVSGNSATFDGGGIYAFNGGTITNSTIANNTADADNNGTGIGGGIFNVGGLFTIRNSIIAGNFDTPNNAGAGAINPDVSGVFTDGGNNLIGDTTGSTNFTVSALVGTAANRLDPQLVPLANNGGTTQTHALLVGSPALDAGNNAFAAGLTTDQRGLPRISNGTVDIGTFEFQVTPVVVTPVVVSPVVVTSAKVGFGGVFPSREDREILISKINERDERDFRDISFTQVLCLDASLATPQTISIPTCKRE